MKTISNALARLATSAVFVIAWFFTVDVAPAAAPEPLVCTVEVRYNPIEMTYDCIVKCAGDDDGCPDCCPPGGSGGGGGSSGGSKGGLSKKCKTCGGRGSGPGGGGGGGEDECCEPEGGMATWSVKEPRLTVFLSDKPFFYKQSRGPDVAFRLVYKDTPGSNNVVDMRSWSIFSIGTNWHTPWRSYFRLSPNNHGYAQGGIPTPSYFHFPGDGSGIDYMQDVSDADTGAYYEFDGTYHTLTYNRGERRIFGPATSVGGEDVWFLNRIEYPGGATNRFEYVTTNSVVRLNKVIDTDGRETTFEYTSSGPFSNLISKVVGPFGQTNVLTYSNGQLVSITDMMGLQSQMEYAGGSVSKLITPYGTNSFYYYPSNSWTGLRVNEHNLRTHLYLFGDGPTNLFPNGANDYASLTAAVSHASIDATAFDTNYNRANSYYWGPRQYGNLSSTTRSNVENSSFQFSSLTTNEFNKGLTRHYLYRQGSSIGSVLSLEREPSPQSDGSTEGKTIWYGHDNKSKPSEESYPKSPQVVAWRYSSTQWRFTHYERRANNRVSSKRETHGEPGAPETQTVTYTAGANNIDITQASGDGEHEYTRGYNAFNQVLNHTNAYGEVTSYQYDGFYRLTNVTHPNGLMTTYVYNGDGYLSSVIDQSGSTGLRTNSYTYTNGLVYTHTDERGLVTTHAYDVFGRLTKTWYPDSTGITNTYDKLDLVSTTDRLGKTSTLVYNSFRQVTQEIDANSPARTNTYAYCDCGALNSVTDPLGNTTSYTYDNAGQRTRVTFPGGTYTDSFFDTAGQVIRTTKSSGVSVTNAYTLDGLLFTATNAFGRMFYRHEGEYFLREWEEDGLDLYSLSCRTNVMVDNNGVTNLYVYDQRGRLVEHIHQLVEVAGDFTAVQDRYVYTTNTTGPTRVSRESVTSEATSWPHVISRATLGGIVSYEYDLLGQKTNEIHKNSSGTAILTNRFKYDVSGNLTNLMDGKAQKTSWEFDQYKRVTRKIDHNGAEMFRYTNDANGRLTARWTPEKGTTTYAYDNVGNLTSINYPNSTDITLAYDGNNRVTNMVDAVGTTRFTYADFGALLSEDGPWENDTVSYTYDNGRRRSGLSLQAPNSSAWSQSYTYDTGNRLSTLASPAGTFTYGYHTGLAGSSPASLVKSIALPSTSAITNNYDTRARMFGTWLRKSDGTLLNKHEYQLNDLDQRTKQTRSAGDYVDYVYDDLGQLTNAVGKELGGVTNRWQEQFSYGYDAAGNLTNRVQHRLTNSFTVNSLNQLTGGSRSGRFSVSGTTTGPATNVTVNTSNSVLYLDYTFASTNHALTDGTNTFTAIGKDNYGRVDTNVVTAFLPASPTYAHDLNGNLTNDSQRVFGYDDENQLTNVMVANSWKSEFIYDGKLRRRIRREFTWQNGAWVQTNEVRYVYDANLVIQERDHFNLAGVTYTRGTDLSGRLEAAGGIGGLLARSDHATLTPQHAYYYADGNGNVAILMDTNQTVVARYFYEPFGDVFSMSGPLAQVNLYRFSSKEAHSISDVTYYLRRYYKASLQRWLNRDPIEERGGLNLYATPRNMIQFIDSWGLFEVVAPRRDATTVVCDGNGGFRIQIGGRKPGKALDCVIECIRAHEQAHINALMEQAPQLCRGQDAGASIAYSHELEEAYNEYLAYEAEVACLERLKSDYCKPRGCDEHIEEELRGAKFMRLMHRRKLPL